MIEICYYVLSEMIDHRAPHEAFSCEKRKQQKLYIDNEFQSL